MIIASLITAAIVLPILRRIAGPAIRGGGRAPAAPPAGDVTPAFRALGAFGWRDNAASHQTVSKLPSSAKR